MPARLSHGQRGATVGRRAVIGALLTALVAFAAPKLIHAATCTGATPCNACKNCSSCAHCAKRGGKCGVCRRSMDR
jgi:hypothetical protein